MRTSQRVLTTTIVVTALAGSYAAATAATRPAKAASASFGTPVVVDFFRPGYEPDVAVAKAGAYKGSTFVSVPNGFSTTMSYIWRSDDNRRSFHMVEGNALGKSTTCVGGGDSELQIDPVNGSVYFNDLQGLTNFSNSRSDDGGHTWQTSCTSVPGAGVDRQWLAIDSNGGTAAVGSGANDGRLYFDYDNVAQDLGPAGSPNQLVMDESMDGVHYGAACQGANAPAPAGPQSVCPLPPAVISYDEGIPGNVIVNNIKGNKFQHRVYAIHTTHDSAAVIVSYCSGKAGDHTAATVAADCTDPTQTDPAELANGNGDRKNVNWHDSYARVPGRWETGQLFPAIAQDTSGNLYATWSEYPAAKNGGSPIGPGAIKMSVSRDGAAHWSAPITVSPANLKNNVMPWITSGSNGRVGIAWYGSTTGKNEKNQWGPDPVDHASWDVYYAVTTNGTAKHPSFGVTKVSDHPVKYGDISTGGLGGSQDRSLGDYMQVQLGQHGEAIITYVDDTSANRNQDTCGGCGETPAEAAGPVMVVTQNGGPSLVAGQSVPKFGRPIGAVHDKAGDAFLAAGGQDVKAPAALDVIGASVKKKDAKNLTITLTTSDPHLASDLAAVPPLGGPVNTWTVRWAAPSYKGLGDGNMFYVAMQSAGGGTPSFYTGSTQAITTTHAKYFTYPATKAIDGRIQGATISWTVPMSAIGNPKKGQGLFSITAFSSTQETPAAPSTLTVPNQGGELGDFNIPNLISASSPFTYYVK
jgi:hypothetical protein